MISAFTIVLLCFWGISAVFNYAYFLHIWQLKEYRLDRMRDFLSTKQGQLFTRSYVVTIRAFITIGFYVFLTQVMSTRTVVAIVFCIEAVYLIRLWQKKNIKRPKITHKALLIAITAISIELAAIVISTSWSVLLLFFVFRFLYISTIIVAFGYPTKYIKQYYVQKATQKLQQYPHLKVVGITGSYGKTTTKVFLSQILRTTYRVIATPKNINTDIGVAKHILDTDFSNIDIYIVEMGAYREHDIKIIAEMTRPIVGILTAINEEHLSLFGSLENTTRTKYELLRSIPPHGLAITNNDNDYCTKYINTLNTNVETFGIEEDTHPTLLVRQTECKKGGGGLCVGYTLDTKTYDYTIPHIMGTHNSTNIAACILAARYLGVSMEPMKQAIEQLIPPEQRLQVYTYGKATIIDDTYNANPDGFKAALDVLGSFPSTKKRIIITRGMLELGEHSDVIHKQIAEEISFYADHLVVITKDFYDALSSGILKKYRTTVELIDTPQLLLQYIQTHQEEEVVILLENRIPSLVYDAIIAKKE